MSTNQVNDTPGVSLLMDVDGITSGIITVCLQSINSYWLDILVASLVNWLYWELRMGNGYWRNRITLITTQDNKVIPWFYPNDTPSIRAMKYIHLTSDVLMGQYDPRGHWNIIRITVIHSKCYAEWILPYSNVSESIRTISSVYYLSEPTNP